jgi:hypothetical protein
MKRIAKKSTLIQDLARKVGYAAGRVVATTQELAESAAAMVNHDNEPTHASSPAAGTPRKHSPRRAEKKASISSATSRSKSKKSAVAKKSPRIKAAAPKSRKRRAASSR